MRIGSADLFGTMIGIFRRTGLLTQLSVQVIGNCPFFTLKRLSRAILICKTYV